jgi:hypothetical protein
MQINHELKMGDLVAFILYHHAHSPTLRRQKYFVCWTLAVAGLLLAALQVLAVARLPDSLWGVSLILLLSGAFYPAFYRAWLSRTVERMFSEGQSDHLLGKKEVSITPVEIVEASATRSTTVRWSAVERIETDGDLVYVYISAVEAIVIPRRAFADEAGFAAFKGAAIQYWRASRGGGDKA